jgi:hypothetical protein
MSEIPRGAIRFNTDSNKPELWDGSQWAEFQLSTPNLGRGVDTEPGARGIFAGGRVSPSPADSNVIEYINISSAGNSLNFGDLFAARLDLAGLSSSTRGVFAGGYTNGNTIDYITISSTGNAADFGDLPAQRGFLAACSSATRGLWAGGTTPAGRVNTIEYVTIESTGNAVDFGDLTVVRRQVSGCSSPTRGVFFGGQNPSPTPTFYNVIDFVTISTLGNASDFGDMTQTNNLLSACSNAIRGIAAGGEAAKNSIEFIIISTLGNATNFGDLTVGRGQFSAAVSSSTRGVFGGGYGSPTYYNTIDYITISTQGDAVDFGDLLGNKFRHGGCSNAHGGL